MNVTTPNASKAVTIVLDTERTIRYGRLAEYRMSSLPRPSTTKDLLDEKKSFAALVNWIWACLVGKDAFVFNSPEDLVQLITDDKIDGLFSAWYETWKSAQPPETESPKVDGSTNGALPALSST